MFVSTRDPGIIRSLKDWQTQAHENGGAELHFVWDNDEMRYGNGFHTLDLVIFYYFLIGFCLSLSRIDCW